MSESGFSKEISFSSEYKRVMIRFNEVAVGGPTGCCSPWLLNPKLGALLDGCYCARPVTVIF